MKRSIPLRRKGFLRRSRKPIPARQIGSGIPPETRLAVLVRDHGHCVSCGCWLANVPSALHHRLMRSRGGGHGQANLLHLCTFCHLEVHTGDTIQATNDGMLLPSGSDPQAVPVLTWAGWRHLLDDGSVLTRRDYAARIAAGGAA